MKPSSDSKRKAGKGNGSGNGQGIVATEASSADCAQLDEMIAVAAYFRAEQRGFAPGNELADWLQAEADYLTDAATEGRNLPSRL